MRQWAVQAQGKVIEAKEGALELRGRKGRGNVPRGVGEKWWSGKAWTCSGERAHPRTEFLKKGNDMVGYLES